MAHEISTLRGGNYSVSAAGVRSDNGETIVAAQPSLA
jgi:hypothetical protein